MIGNWFLVDGVYIVKLFDRLNVCGWFNVFNVIIFNVGGIDIISFKCRNKDDLILMFIYCFYCYLFVFMYCLLLYVYGVIWLLF